MAFITAPAACFIFISHLSNSKINLSISFLYCILYLGLASLLSFGIFIVYSRNIAGDAPRYIYGFAVLLQSAC